MPTVDENNTGVKANASAVRADINSMYKMKGTLGSGTYSVVKLAVDRRTGEDVAIKVITKSQLSGDDTVSLNVCFEIWTYGRERSRSCRCCDNIRTWLRLKGSTKITTTSTWFRSCAWEASFSMRL